MPPKDVAEPASKPAGRALARSMHGFGALMITLSGLSPSIGVFVVGSTVIREAGSGVFLCFAAAALVGVLMANVYGELVSAFPDTGGEYTILGKTLGPAAGFATLGLLLLGFTIGLALTAEGVADYLRVVAPGLKSTPTALVLVAVVTVIAILNIRINALVTGTFLSLEVLSLVVLAGLGLWHPHRGLSVIIHPLTLAAGGGGGAGLAASLKLVPTALAVMGAAAAGALYAFNGYGSVVLIAEEIHDAHRRVAGVIFAALGVACLLQLVPMLAVLLGAPDLAALIHAPAPLSYFVSVSGGRALAVAISLAVALAIFNTMIAVALMAGRQLYSTGRDGVWTGPLNRAFSAIHPRLGSPWIATLTMGAITLVWCFLPLRLLVILIAGGTVCIYSGLCLAVLAGRRNGSTRHASYRMPFFPAIPLLALLCLGAVAWTSLQDRDGRLGMLSSLSVITVCALLYQGVLKRRGGWEHRGPGGV